MNHDQNTHVGDVLKKKRLERNISLKDAENATSIRVSYLQAIEGGELNKLISPIYAQGFVRQYATFLGLDGEQLIKDHIDLFKGTTTHEFDYGIGTLEVRDNPSAGVKWLPNLAWLGAFALLILIAWYFAHLLDVI